MGYGPAHRAASRSGTRGGLALVLLALAATACAPIGITRVDTQTAHRLLTVSALSAEYPSEPTAQVLRRRGLETAFREDAPGALATLHAALAVSEDPDTLFALAELSFVYADRSADRRYYLGSPAVLHAPAGPARPDPGVRGARRGRHRRGHPPAAAGD